MSLNYTAFLRMPLDEFAARRPEVWETVQDLNNQAERHEAMVALYLARQRLINAGQLWDKYNAGIHQVIAAEEEEAERAEQLNAVMNS